ncbi:hypothetical protein BT63DRAFT_453862 [Microthyrium microscopicum]|uniref:Uncharacterized protein n=1 Tax=Microthyrium microscopicum TaxID=703497 RepID=A0A6A6UJ22_9PEZI|nr:hypothetical protein BT63DRAFT_453862 [Microthyrium microscopicum]
MDLPTRADMKKAVKGCKTSNPGLSQGELFKKVKSEQGWVISNNHLKTILNSGKSTEMRMTLTTPRPDGPPRPSSPRRPSPSDSFKQSAPSPIYKHLNHLKAGDAPVEPVERPDSKIDNVSDSVGLLDGTELPETAEYPEATNLHDSTKIPEATGLPETTELSETRAGAGNPEQSLDPIHILCNATMAQIRYNVRSKRVFKLYGRGKYDFGVSTNMMMEGGFDRIIQKLIKRGCPGPFDAFSAELVASSGAIQYGVNPIPYLHTRDPKDIDRRNATYKDFQMDLKRRQLKWPSGKDTVQVDERGDPIWDEAVDGQFALQIYLIDKDDGSSEYGPYNKQDFISEAT